MLRLLIFIFGVLIFSVLGFESEGHDVACYKKEKNLMLWDMAHYCISKAREIYFKEPRVSNSRIFDNEKRIKSRPYLEKAKQLIFELEENYLLDEPDSESSTATCDQKALDCSDFFRAGQIQSGVYMIWPAGRKLEAYCDMDTDGGGWTVIQRRGNFSNRVDFFRGWYDYEYGFGNITRDFWFGNENIYLLTNQSEYEIRFDLTNVHGEKRFAVYKTFRLGDERTNYTLHIDDYSGDAGDSMAYHNNHIFSTMDTENSTCAKERKAGWWYDYCTESNLNGMYRPGVEGRDGITWYSWHHHTSLAGSEIKLRKKN